MTHYIGLDVTQRQTAICIVDDKGKKVAESKTLTLPFDIHGWIIKQVEADSISKVGLEAGAMSAWLFIELSKLGLPMLCLEAFQASEFIKTQRNKTDKNDAYGLAQLVRMGGDFIKPVIIRTQSSQEIRTLLRMRQHLVKTKTALQNNITGTLKPFGLVTQRGTRSAKVFHERVLETLARADDRGLNIRDAVIPSLDLCDNLCKQIDVLDKQVKVQANAHSVCRRLMTAPGVASVVSLSFVTAIDDPKRFKNPSDVGAYFGLTSRQYQSGETDLRGPASLRGDTMTRTHLVNAATSLLTSTKKWCPLKAWGMKIAKRHGFKKARVAVARKLSIILYQMWMREEDFRWTTISAGKTLAGGAVPA